MASPPSSETVDPEEPAAPIDPDAPLAATDPADAEVDPEAPPAPGELPLPAVTLAPLPAETLAPLPLTAPASSSPPPFAAPTAPDEVPAAPGDARVGLVGLLHAEKHNAPRAHETAWARSEWRISHE